MKWPTLVTATALTVGISGCGFFGGDEEETTPPTTQETAAADTPASLEEAPALEQVPATTTPARETRAQPGQTAMDLPWTPTHTGTVDPGMTRDQVIAVWGTPFVERSYDNWVYIHFRNGCEVSCGTNDIVLLQDGQVVDAIVRGQGHTYSGVSSSPPGRTAERTMPMGGVG
jgi:hypothetical protein